MGVRLIDKKKIAVALQKVVTKKGLLAHKQNCAERTFTEIQQP